MFKIGDRVRFTKRRTFVDYYGQCGTIMDCYHGVTVRVKVDSSPFTVIVGYDEIEPIDIISHLAELDR